MAGVLGIKAREECTSLKELAVNGSDLIVAGFAPGKELGEVLNRLLAQVSETPEMNTKEILLEAARRL